MFRRQADRVLCRSPTSLETSVLTLHHKASLSPPHGEEKTTQKIIPKEKEETQFSGRYCKKQCRRLRFSSTRIGAGLYRCCISTWANPSRNPSCRVSALSTQIFRTGLKIPWIYKTSCLCEGCWINCARADHPIWRRYCEGCELNCTSNDTKLRKSWNSEGGDRH